MSRGRLHIFSREDDGQIMAQARGEILFTELRNRTKAGRDALARRAKELGVTLRVYKRNGRAVRIDNYMQAKPDEVVTDNYYADWGREGRIERDLLLERLVKVHGDRTYG